MCKLQRGQRHEPLKVFKRLFSGIPQVLLEVSLRWVGGLAQLIHHEIVQHGAEQRRVDLPFDGFDLGKEIRRQGYTVRCCNVVYSRARVALLEELAKRLQMLQFDLVKRNVQ